jgi:hypothetical protein
MESGVGFDDEGGTSTPWVGNEGDGRLVISRKKHTHSNDIWRKRERKEKNKWPGGVNVFVCTWLK